MSLTATIPLQALEPDSLRDLQEKYPGAQFNLTFHGAKTVSRLTEKMFWDIIERLDWSDENADDGAVLEPAVAYLASLPVSNIYDFKNLLSEKLYALDTLRHAQNTGKHAWKTGKYFSVDDFLYARCCVVANGRAYFEKVLHDPAEMPKDATFEPLLTLANKAYQRKTGKNLSFVTARNIETYSNEKGWKNA